MKFILTQELGRLSKWLRILGYDAVYFADSNYSALLLQALRDGRIVITRNAGIVHKMRAIRLVQVTSDEVNEQLKQVIGQLNISPAQRQMFTRCLICNTELSGIDKQLIRHKVPEYVFNTQDAFFSCPSCRRIYWPGTHWGNAQRFLEKIWSP